MDIQATIAIVVALILLFSGADLGKVLAVVILFILGPRYWKVIKDMIESVKKREFFFLNMLVFVLYSFCIITGIGYLFFNGNGRFDFLMGILESL